MILKSKSVVTCYYKLQKFFILDFGLYVFAPAAELLHHFGGLSVVTKSVQKHLSLTNRCGAERVPGCFDVTAEVPDNTSPHLSWQRMEAPKGEISFVLWTSWSQQANSTRRPTMGL